MEATIKYLECFRADAPDYVLFDHFERHNDMLEALMAANNIKLPADCYLSDVKLGVRHVTDYLDSAIGLPLDDHFYPADYEYKLETLLFKELKKFVEEFNGYDW